MSESVRLGFWFGVGAVWGAALCGCVFYLAQLIARSITARSVKPFLIGIGLMPAEEGKT